MKKLSSVAIIGVVLFTPSAFGEQINIAVASNFVATMQKIVDDYKKDNPDAHINILAGATGHHYQQIINHAPIDIFFAADQKRPQLLEEQGRGHNRFTYAQGQLVLLHPHNRSYGDIATTLKNIGGKIALADPNLAPYGKAAEQALIAMGLFKGIESGEYVFGKNIGSTYQMVRTGGVKLGFVALSQVKNDAELTASDYDIVPAAWYDPIKQDAVVIKYSKDVEDFIRHFAKERVKNIIKEDGYSVP